MALTATSGGIMTAAVVERRRSENMFAVGR
jgi:hypothetical protein